MAEPSLLVKGYVLVIKQLVDKLLLLEHNDVAAEAIPIEVLPALRSTEVMSESDLQQVQKLHAMALYLASFSNFVLKKRVSSKRIVIPDRIPDLGLFRAARVLIITSSTPSALALELKQHNFDTLEVVGIRPALRALLHSTMLGACVFETCDVLRFETSQLDADLQAFVGRGGRVFGFGSEFAELCRHVFFSKWCVDSAGSSEVALALRILPSNPFFQDLAFESQLQLTLRLNTLLIHNVAESECLYEAGEGALVFSSPLSMIANKGRRMKYSTRSGFAIGAYGSGFFCYCGNTEASSNPHILLPLRSILSLGLNNPPDTLLRVPEIPSSTLQMVVWEEEKYDYDDTDDEDGISLIEALSNFAKLRDAALKPKLRAPDVQAYSDEARVEIDGSSFDWLCRFA